MVENRVFVGRIFAFLQSVETEVLVGACADEDLLDVFSIDFSVFSECEGNFLVKGVDEEIKKLVLVNLTVCSLGFRHISASRHLN